MKTLIAIEGNDRTGKDTILKRLPSRNIAILDQDAIRAEVPNINDYKDQEKFKAFLEEFIKRVSLMLNKAFKEHDVVALTRWSLSDKVFSEIFNRVPLTEYVTSKYLEYPVVVKNFIMLWSNYDEYKKRLKMIGEEEQYSEEVLISINSKFFRKANYDDVIMYIDADTPNKLIEDNLVKFIKNQKVFKPIKFNLKDLGALTSIIVISDMDGVLTNGKSVYGLTGKVYKEYGSYDHEVIDVYKKLGVRFLFVSADKNGEAISRKRIEDLHCEFRLVPGLDRAKLIEQFKQDGNFVVFIGDSISDQEAMFYAHKSGMPKNASPLLKDALPDSYVSPYIGGEGAFADIVYNILS